MHLRALVVATLFLCMPAIAVSGGVRPGLTLVEVEYCAVLEAETCLSAVALVEASVSWLEPVPAEEASAVEVDATAYLEAGHTVCAENGLVCVTPKGPAADGRLICLGITIDAQALAEGVLGDYVYIFVDMDPVDPTSSECSFGGPSSVVLETSCLGGLLEGDILGAGENSFFKVVRLFPPNCGQPVSKEPISWGAVKSLYR